MSSDSDIAVGRAARAEPDDDASSDIGVPRPEERGAQQAKQERQPGEAPRSGLCGAWLVGSPDAAAGSGEPRRVVGFAKVGWEVEAPLLAPFVAAGAPDADGLRRRRSRAKDAWGALRYRVHSVCLLDDVVPLPPDLDCGGIRSADLVRRVCVESGVSARGLPLLHAFRQFGAHVITVLLLPLSLAASMSHATFPLLVRTCHLGMRLPLQELCPQFPARRLLSRIRAAVRGASGAVQYGPMTKAEWQAEYN